MTKDYIDEVTEQVLAELASCVRQVSIDSITQAADLIEYAPRVFVTGAGRSGLCMRAFAMRLMHLGKTVFVVGDVTTPSIENSDLLIIGSRSGMTTSLLAFVGQLQRHGATSLLLTADSRSPLARLADQQIVIPTFLSEGSNDRDADPSVQPLGTLFEQALFIVNDRIILEMMKRMDVGATQMAERHANLQ